MWLEHVFVFFLSLWLFLARFSDSVEECTDDSEPIGCLVLLSGLAMIVFRGIGRGAQWPGIRLVVFIRVRWEQLRCQVLETSPIELLMDRV